MCACHPCSDLTGTINLVSSLFLQVCSDSIPGTEVADLPVALATARIFSYDILVDLGLLVVVDKIPVHYALYRQVYITAEGKVSRP